MYPSHSSLYRSIALQWDCQDGIACGTPFVSIDFIATCHSHIHSHNPSLIRDMYTTRDMDYRVCHRHSQQLCSIQLKLSFASQIHFDSKLSFDSLSFRFASMIRITQSLALTYTLNCTDLWLPQLRTLTCCRVHNRWILF